MRTRHRERPGGAWIRFRGASLIAVTTALYLAAVVGTLYTLETAYYIPAKKDIITTKIKQRTYVKTELMQPAADAARMYAESLYRGDRPDVVEDRRQHMLEMVRTVIREDPVVVRIVYEDAQGVEHLRVEAPEKLDRQSNFSNRLFRPHTLVEAAQSFATNPGMELLANFKFFETTPVHDDDIAALTSQYRLYMILAFGVLTILYYFLLVIIFLPLSRVLNYMNRKPGEGPVLIPKTRSPLERAYNNLARDATLTQFSKELREYISTEGISHIQPVLKRIPALVEGYLDIDRCHVYTFLKTGKQGGWRAEASFANENENASQGLAIQEQLNQDDPDANPQFWQAKLRQIERDGRKETFFCDILDLGPERLTLFVVYTKLNAPGPTPWWLEFFALTAQELRFAIGSVEEQRRMILQEKSKANISLSRNLGHDLTNIIATSKLELMSMNAFLSLKPEDVSKSPKKQMLFHESLEALLNNTRFLQEIVNLYRSFSYLQKPNFEEASISDLVENVAQLYRLSVSRNVTVETRLEADMPLSRVEPRLLRLALFNLLTNAADSLKRVSGADGVQGAILISTRTNRDLDVIEIAVEDNGIGICDENGKLMHADELAEIFRLGYSTKSNQEGEGLGLNWVQTIVREFHGGDIVAANRSPRGASFTIRLPIHQRGGSQSGDSVREGTTKLTAAQG